MAVLHHRVKRKIWEFTKEENKDKIISLLACSEHQRWKAERIFSGWKGGPDRDDERKFTTIFALIRKCLIKLRNMIFLR